MEFQGLNYLAIPVAAVAGMAFGALWYGVLFGRPWRAIVGIDSSQPKPTPMIIAFVAQLV